MTQRKNKQGAFIKELAGKASARSAEPKKVGVRDWKTPIASPKMPRALKAPRWNDMRATKSPSPASDIPLADSGRIDVAAVRKTVQTFNKKFHKE